MRPTNLAGELVDRHELLRPGLQVPEGHLASDQLIADDHGEMGAIADGRLELLAELSMREVRARGDPGGPQVRGDSQPRGRVFRVGTDDDRDRRRLRCDACCPSGLAQGEEQPVDSDAEPDPGRRAAAEQLDEAVVPSATTDRLLLSLTTGDVELDRKSVV